MVSFKEKGIWKTSEDDRYRVLGSFDAMKDAEECLRQHRNVRLALRKFIHKENDTYKVLEDTAVVDKEKTGAELRSRLDTMAYPKDFSTEAELMEFLAAVENEEVQLPENAKKPLFPAYDSKDKKYRIMYGCESSCPFMGIKPLRARIKYDETSQKWVSDLR